MAAATGMGGISKTELAWQYVQAHRADYPGGVWWLTVRGGDLLSQVIGYTGRMGLGQPPDEVAAESAKAQWCFDHWVGAVPGARLLVLDDVVEYGQVKPLLPSESSFRVLLTTRRKFGPPMRRLELGVLKRAAAFRLLRSLVLDDGRLKAELAEAKQLCDWVGRLPLGIELVGRYLAGKPDLSIATLLERLEDKQLAALAVRKVPEEMPYQLNLMAAFELSWQELDDDGQRLGCLLSLFALAPIPWELVQACVPELDDEDLEECRDEQLLKRSLLERLEAGRYQLHQVLREAFTAKLPEREDAVALQTGFAQTLSKLAAQTSQIVTLTEHEQMREAIPHLEKVMQFWTSLLEEGDESLWTFVSLARFYQSQSLWERVEHCYDECLRMTQGRYGSEHPLTATSLNNLAELYRAMGRYRESEPMYEQALEIREAKLGPVHLDTAITLNNLAVLYKLMGRYLEAEPVYVRTVGIITAQLGSDHFDTAMSLNNLAELYRAMERDREAEPLYKQALKIIETQLGLDHLFTAMILNNLAELFRLIGRYGEAEPLHERALAIYEVQLGPEHPDTATILSNLAGLYQSLGRNGEAEILYERSLSIIEAQLGPAHPHTATSLKNLAVFYCYQSKWEKAELLMLRALIIQLKVLGEEHPDTRGTISSLANLVSTVVKQRQVSELSKHPLTQQLLKQL